LCLKGLTFTVWIFEKKVWSTNQASKETKEEDPNLNVGEESVSLSLVNQLESEDAIGIWDSESGVEVALVIVLQNCANIWVDSDELHLDFVGL